MHLLLFYLPTKIDIDAAVVGLFCLQTQQTQPAIVPLSQIDSKDS
jgi:hypothetical protein